MLLACDIGNSNLVVGVFDGADPAASWRLPTEPRWTADQYAATVLALLDSEGIPADDVTGAVVSSVVPPLSGVWHDVCLRYFGIAPVVVSAETAAGLSIGYAKPEQVGADRLANAVAARELYDGDLVIVDFGTAVTVCAVTADGQYLGGMICPGIGTAADALYERAAMLHPVRLDGPVSTIGRDTAESLRSGIVLGYAAMVDGLVGRIRRDALSPEATVIASGGWAELVADHSDTIQYVEPDLTLIGLRIIYEANSGD